MKISNEFRVKKRIKVVIYTEVQKFDKKINLHTGTQKKVRTKLRKKEKIVKKYKKVQKSEGKCMKFLPCLTD